MSRRSRLLSEQADPGAGAFLETNGFRTVTVAEPISVVWIGRHEECLGVMEMMTPSSRSS